MIGLAATKQVVTGKVLLWLAIAAGLLLVLGANVHLVYVAERSQPSCVAHVRHGGSASGHDSFSAAKSACSPQRGAAQSRM